MSWAEVPRKIRAQRRLEVFARDGDLCQLRYPGICTLVAEVADHIRDRETHGDGLDNLQAACRPCNGHKGKPSAQDPEHRPHPGAWF